MHWILSSDEKGHRVLRLLADISLMLDLDPIDPLQTVETAEPNETKIPEPASNGVLRHAEPISENGEPNTSKPIGV